MRPLRPYLSPLLHPPPRPPPSHLPLLHSHPRLQNPQSPHLPTPQARLHHSPPLPSPPPPPRTHPQPPKDLTPCQPPSNLHIVSKQRKKYISGSGVAKSKSPDSAGVPVFDTQPASVLKPTPWNGQSPRSPTQQELLDPRTHLNNATPHLHPIHQIP